MEQPLAKIDPAISALMHGSFGKDGALKPFAREIGLIMYCQIVGISRRNLKKVERKLVHDAMLSLKREPDNKCDPDSIMILTEAGYHLGYVPHAKNEALARLMDAGKLLFARVAGRKRWVGDHLRVGICIYLRDF
jgi:HIRAN domain